MGDENVIEQEVSNEETENRVIAELRLALEESRQATIDQAVSEFRGYLKEAAKPDRTQLADVNGDTKPAAGSAGRVRTNPHTALLYRSLPKDVQGWRTPDTDHWCAQWMRALPRGNFAAMRQAHDELAKLGFGYDAGERAALLEGSADATSGIGDGSAAPLIPLPLANTIVLARDKASRFRSRVAQFTTDAQTLRVPTSGVATVTMAAEQAGATNTEPTPSSVLLSPNKMQAHFQISQETIDDSAFNIVGYLAERAGSAMGAKEDQQISTATGTAPEFTGSLDSTTITSVDEATSTELAYVDLPTLFFALPSQYRGEGCYWMCNAAFLTFLSQLVDTAGRPILAGTTQGAMPVTDDATLHGNQGVIGTIFGRPVLEAQTDAGGIYIGNLNYYGLCTKGGLVVAASEHIGFATGEVHFRITQRIDGAVLVADAFRSMDGITSLT